MRFCCFYSRPNVSHSLTRLVLGTFLIVFVVPALAAAPGDLDGDGGATALDLVRLLNHIQAAGSPGHTNRLPTELLSSADLNQDGAIDQADVELLRDAVLELRTVPSAALERSIRRELRIAASLGHSLAIRENGMLWAWGNNQFGQVGDGTTSTRSLPVPIAPNLTWKAVVAGDNHTLGLREDGTLWAWGWNRYGQLGNGTTNDQLLPVATGSNFTWKAVAAGQSHSMAIAEDGTLWGWGYNEVGQLGDGTVTHRPSPVLIAPNVRWNAVAAGGDHSLGLRQNGTLWAWGNNSRGQVGDGTTTNRLLPVQIDSNFTWKAVGAGLAHSIAIREDGMLWAWGWNQYAQLGNGTTTDQPWPVPIASNLTCKGIAAGYSHNLIIAEDGTLWAWGLNDQGQVGDGTRIRRLWPVPVASNFTWKTLAVGFHHSLASREDGTLWAWGVSSVGQLGDGTTRTRRLLPVPIATNLFSATSPHKYRLALHSVRGLPDHTIELPMDFSAAMHPPAIVALQADVEFESAIVSLGAPGEGDALSDRFIASRELRPGMRRVLIYSTNSTPFPNGVLATLPFSIGPKVFHNPRIVLTNVILVTANATSAPFISRPGGIAIVPVVVGSDGVTEGFITVPPDPVNERCFVVQSSRDLRSWVNIVTNTVIGNVLQFVDPTIRPSSPRFYRAVACP